MFRIRYAFRVQCILTSPDGEYCIHKKGTTKDQNDNISPREKVYVCLFNTYIDSNFLDEFM